MKTKIIDLNEYRVPESVTLKNKRNSKRSLKPNMNLNATNLPESILKNENDFIIEREEGYYAYKKNELTRISNFVIDPIEEIFTGSKTILKIKLKNINHETTLEIDLKDFSKISTFQCLINQKGLDYWFFGNQDALNHVRTSLLQKKYIKVDGFDFIGFHYQNKDQAYFITQEAVLNKAGIVDQAKRYYGILPMQTDLASANPITSEELSFLLKHLFRFNELNVSVPLIAYALSCFLKEKLSILNVPFNHLFVTGEAGAGKTQTMNYVLKKLFGMTDEFNASQITSAAININATRSNTLPFILDEYKPSMMTKMQIDLLSNLLRNSYNGTPSIKSSRDGGLVMMKPTTPIIMVGEMPITESANQERAIQLYFSKRASITERHTSSFKMIKANGKLMTRLGRSVVTHMLNDDNDDLIKIKADWESKILPEFPSRIKNSISNLMLGLRLLTQVCTSLEIDFEMETGFKQEDLFNIILESVEKDMMIPGENGYSIVEKTLVLINELVEAGLIQEGQHFQLERDNLLALRLIDVFPKIKPYLKSQCVSSFEILERKEFEKQAKLMGLGKPNQQHRFKGQIGNQKVFKFDVEAIAHLNLDALLV